MKIKQQTIFAEYLSDQPFVDRFQKESEKSKAVDVLIPIIHTNELWEKNLLSIYREIPVKRLLIADGGCIDDSLKILKKFPRVTVYNHRKFVSLGYSIRKLIEEVKTDWFIYLHSDVYLPDGWFDQMSKNKKKYDWFECRQHQTVLIDYLLSYPEKDRSFSGTQMGRKEAFKDILPQIDDDYLYRNEDMIFADLIVREGFKYGRVKEIVHYHQIMNKKSQWQRTFKNVSFSVDKSPKEEKREWIMQAKGIIKYSNPDSLHLIQGVQGSVIELRNRADFDFHKFQQWVEETNSLWLPYLRLSPQKIIMNRFQKLLKRIYDYIVK